MPNGLALCKMHHAAYDADILGVAPDYLVHVRRDVLEEDDGPMLRHGLQEMNGHRIILPREAIKRPNQEYLEERFGRFRAAGRSSYRPLLVECDGRDHKSASYQDAPLASGSRARPLRPGPSARRHMPYGREEVRGRGGLHQGLCFRRSPRPITPYGSKRFQRLRSLLGPGTLATLAATAFK